MSRSIGSPISAELGLAEEARIVPVPTSGTEYICPYCEHAIPTLVQQRLAKPAKYEGVLNDVFRCPMLVPTTIKGGGHRLTPHEVEKGVGTDPLGTWVRPCGFVFSPKSTAVVLMK